MMNNSFISDLLTLTGLDNEKKSVYLSGEASLADVLGLAAQAGCGIFVTKHSGEKRFMEAPGFEMTPIAEKYPADMSFGEVETLLKANSEVLILRHAGD